MPKYTFWNITQNLFDQFLSNLKELCSCLFCTIHMLLVPKIAVADGIFSAKRSNLLVFGLNFTLLDGFS